MPAKAQAAQLLRVVLGREDVTGHLDGELTFSSKDPGGFELASFGFAKDVGIPRGTEVRIDSGLDVAWQGRVSDTERGLGGAPETQVSCEGAGAVLKDGVLAEIYVDRDLAGWGPASSARRLAMLNSNYGVHDPQTEPDTTNGQPAVRTQVEGSWASPKKPICEALYDAGSENLAAAVYYSFAAQASISPADVNWGWLLFAGSSDTFASLVSTANLRAASGAGYWTLSAARRFLAIQHYYNATPAGADGAQYAIQWSKLAVYGDHGLTRRGADPGGFYPSDIVGYIAGLVAGLQPGVIQEASEFTIPHLAFKEAVAYEQHVVEAAKFVDRHWGVWESQSLRDSRPRLDFRPRPTEPTVFLTRDRLDDFDPQERLDTLHNRVTVAYTDPAGQRQTVTRTRTVPELENAGIGRTLEIDMGVGTQASAELFGDMVLAVSAAQGRASGAAQVPSWVETRPGHKPAHMVRPGIDMLRIPDYPGWGLSQAGMQVGDFQIARAETRVGSDGPKTTLELGHGGDLLEVLQARLQVATQVAAG